MGSRTNCPVTNSSVVNSVPKDREARFKAVGHRHLKSAHVGGGDFLPC